MSSKKKNKKEPFKEFRELLNSLNYAWNKHLDFLIDNDIINEDVEFLDRKMEALLGMVKSKRMIAEIVFKEIN